MTSDQKNGEHHNTGTSWGVFGRWENICIPSDGQVKVIAGPNLNSTKRWPWAALGENLVHVDALVGVQGQSLLYSGDFSILCVSNYDGSLFCTNPSLVGELVIYELMFDFVL